MKFSHTAHEGKKLEHRPKRQIGHAGYSTRRPISNGLLYSAILIYFVWLTLSPRTAFISLLTTVAWISVGFSFLRLVASLASKPADLGRAKICEDLPNYSILVPLFHEAQMVNQLMEGLDALRYPRDKLEIILITEEVDPFTTQTVSSSLRPPFLHIIVPKGSPQTKPRALNFALQYASGELITIYDAEDRPHPDQLLAAVYAFNAKSDWAAVQAPLEYYNYSDNWLTRQFALEYAALFHVWVPFLARLGLPFPLGGTSNHIRRNVLDSVKGWDSHNVTEDADLSFRLAAYGHKIGYIHPPTQEEAVCIYRDWHLQRSRWIKGFIQTWNVHMASPFAPGGIRGGVRFITLQLTLGMTLLSVLFYTPVIIGLPLIAALLWWAGVPFDISLIYGLTFAFSVLVGSLIGIIGAYRLGKPDLIKSSVFMPLYWLLHFTPALRAFKELKSQRFHWHKTRHGVSRAAKIKTFDHISSMDNTKNRVPLRRPID